MAFETNTLVDGEWTTTTLDLDTVLRHYDQQDKEAMKAVEVDQVPSFGLLTQTVISSPLAHWILPVRLRSPDINDVAFIGDGFVQVRELRPDGYLRDVIRKDNFVCRIRNARVVGSINAYKEEMAARDSTTNVKDENKDQTTMDICEDHKKGYAYQGLPLPPQVILLQLESGDSVFLELRYSEGGELELFSHHHRLPGTGIGLQAGMHLTVDPSSRYVAIGCSEGLFSIYALHSREELNEQYSQSTELHYVQAETTLHTRGVIHKMEFLYPSRGDEKHIILLVLVVIRGKTRMIVYEWETGRNITDIKPNNAGHSLAESRQMPLLLIPLLLNSAFILVTETSIAVCHDFLESIPHYVENNTDIQDQTAFHHGLGSPHWTAWARPGRRPEWTADHDSIYLAREDGIIRYLELTSNDFLDSEVDVGELNRNNGTAFTILDPPGKMKVGMAEYSGDLLITGGESGVGGTYVVEARKPPVPMEILHNWSPAIDFIIVEETQDLDFNQKVLSNEACIPGPSRIFACVGKGSTSTVAEFRSGLEANIGLEMDYDTHIVRAWVLSPTNESHDASDESLFLLSLIDRSALLQLSSDATEISEFSQDATQFDLQHRTIAAGMCGKMAIQVTENSIVLTIGPTFAVQKDVDFLYFENQEHLASDSTIGDALIHEDLVLYTISSARTIYLQLLETRVNIDKDGQVTANPHVRNLGKYVSNISSLAMCRLGQIPYAIAAKWEGTSVQLIFQSTLGDNNYLLDITGACCGNKVLLEGIVSIALSSSPAGYLTLLCGTRNGYVLTLYISESPFQLVDFQCDKIGKTSVTVTRDFNLESQDLFFVNCDFKLFSLSRGLPRRPRLTGKISNRHRRIDQIWLTDALNQALPQPNINSVARLKPNPSGGFDAGLLLVSGSQLLLTGLSIQPKVVPRYLPLGGTPSRIIFSHILGALIVAASVGGKSTLQFIDPDTGENLSRPVDKKGNDLEFIAGLGYPDRIFRVLEWPYVKDGNRWHFIIVTTGSGRLLIISAEKEAQIRFEARIGHMKPKIRFWTRYKFKCNHPIYSAIGFPDGVFYSSGEELYCETLDVVEKSFKRVAQHKLPSAAWSMSYKNDQIYVVTTDHSLEILKLVPNSDGGADFVLMHVDQITRPTLHHRLIGNNENNNLGRPEVNLVSDKHGSVVGLWARQDSKANILEILFEAQLPRSILRFQPSVHRPSWDPFWSLPSRKSNLTGEDRRQQAAWAEHSWNDEESLGLSMDGTITHFTVINLQAWKFLRFLINLAKDSNVCEFGGHEQLSLEPAVMPRTMMHVDGDILKRCLEDESLEDMLCIGQETEEAVKVYSKFCELLHELHGGSLEKNALSDVYIDQAYEDLAFYVRPIL
ncbi:hypothetical protein B7494_g395 [Chlorociboria aeruginascens]|nr:hypothetical protein B7494_g395 [Chlorociboria aeruginascens]